MRCVVQCSAVLRCPCAVLCCAVVLSSAVLCCAALRCAALWSVVVRWVVLCCAALCCAVVLGCAVQCSAVLSLCCPVTCCAVVLCCAVLCYPCVWCGCTARCPHRCARTRVSCKFAKHARKLTLRVLRTRKPILQICKASKQFPKECNLFIKHARKLLHAYMYAAARTQSNAMKQIIFAHNCKPICKSCRCCSACRLRFLDRKICNVCNCSANLQSTGRKSKHAHAQAKFASKLHTIVSRFANLAGVAAHANCAFLDRKICNVCNCSANCSACKVLRSQVRWERSVRAI